MEIRSVFPLFPAIRHILSLKVPPRPYIPTRRIPIGAHCANIYREYGRRTVIQGPLKSYELLRAKSCNYGTDSSAY